MEDAPDVGELITIVGPSGCGKSTILRIIAGLKPHFPPTTGEALVFGKPVQEPGPDRGLVDQKYSLLPHLNVLENIAFGLSCAACRAAERRPRPRTGSRKSASKAPRRKYPSELSGGMQQRVAIAATLILQPRILLMDEPFGALDPGIRLRMQELLIQTLERAAGHGLPRHPFGGRSRLPRRPRVSHGRQTRAASSRSSRSPARLNRPKQSRRKPWFINFCQALLRRLEESLDRCRRPFKVSIDASTPPPGTFVR